MITITDCTPDDSAAVAALWNARTLDAESCWFQAAQATPELLVDLLAKGHTILMVNDDGTPIAFGLVNGPTINALAATTQVDLYRLMLEWCQRNLAAGRDAGSSVVASASNREKTWIDQLGDALVQVPYAVHPQTGQTALLNVSCDFETLAATLVAELAAMGAAT